MKIVLLGLVCFGGVWVLATLCYAQEKSGLDNVDQVKQRIVRQGYQHYDNEPLKLLGCQVGNLSFADCSRIEANNAWWQKIKFIVKNVSTKTISGLNPVFRIEKQGDMSVAIGINLYREDGPIEIPDYAGKSTGRFSNNAFLPGDVAFLKPYEHEIKHFREMLDLRGVVDIQRTLLDIRSVYFTDGTTWWFGRESGLQSGQTDDLTRKLIRYSVGDQGAPITISRLEAHGKTIKPGEPFVTDDSEWLKDIRITFQNNSKKTIRRVVFYFTLYEGHPIFPPVSEPINYGVRLFGTADEKPITGSLAPGRSETAMMEPRLYKSLRTYSSSWKTQEQQTTAEIYLSEIVFTDGIKWERGCYHQPDPDRRRQWLFECMK